MQKKRNSLYPQTATRNNRHTLGESPERNVQTRTNPIKSILKRSSPRAVQFDLNTKSPNRENFRKTFTVKNIRSQLIENEASDLDYGNEGEPVDIQINDHRGRQNNRLSTSEMDSNVFSNANTDRTQPSERGLAEINAYNRHTFGREQQSSRQSSGRTRTPNPRYSSQYEED